MTGVASPVDSHPRRPFPGDAQHAPPCPQHTSMTHPAIRSLAATSSCKVCRIYNPRSTTPGHRLPRLDARQVAPCQSSSTLAQRRAAVAYRVLTVAGVASWPCSRHSQRLLLPLIRIRLLAAAAPVILLRLLLLHAAQQSKQRNACFKGLRVPPVAQAAAAWPTRMGQPTTMLSP